MDISHVDHLSIRWPMTDNDTNNIINIIDVDLTVRLGYADIPVHHLLRMGRGAMINLNVAENDEVVIFVNDQPIAMGEVVVKSDRIAVSVTRMLKRATVEANLF